MGDKTGLDRVRDDARAPGVQPDAGDPALGLAVARARRLRVALDAKPDARHHVLHDWTHGAGVGGGAGGMDAG